MLLAVDAGNTQTVFGLFAEQALQAHWRVATRPDVTADELGALLRAMLAGRGYQTGDVDGVIIASVVPDVNATLETVAREHFGSEPVIVGPGTRTGMPILYENPHEVGADRIVNAVAAQARYGAPVIVVDFGTATTFDIVGPTGEYLGGVIAPGLGISAEALFRRAARLHRVGIRRPARVVGRNTEHSLQAGLFFGYAGLVEGLVRRIRRELGLEIPVVATGGLAGTLAAELDFVRAVDPDLTLHGLRLLWDRNRR